jgi:Cu2+-exporting ATPase
MEEKTEDKHLSLNSGLCFHCGLPVRKGFKSKIAREEKEFCCSGCKIACELIYSVNAGSYYKNRIGFSEAPVKNEKKPYPYNSELFRKQYLQSNNGTITEVTLHLENLHCPSCIWVIEKVLGNLPGIKTLSVNFTTQRANIAWDESKLSLQYIIDTLLKIGYPPAPVEKSGTENNIHNKNASFLMRMVISAFGMISTMFLAEPTYFSYVQDLDQLSARVLQYLALIIATPVFLYVIVPYFKGFINAFRYRVFTMDLTIFSGASLIYLYSTLATLKGHSPVYFDCLTMFLFLITLGRFIECSIQQKIFHKAEQSIKNYPKQATVIKNGENIIVHTDEIKPGDLILVRPGEQVPVDGYVTEGESHADESLISGESNPVSKKQGNKVFGGSVNLEGAIYFKAEKIAVDSTLQQIAALAENINTKKSFRQSSFDKIANSFIAFVLLLTIAVYIYYLKQNPEIAVLRAIAVLVVSCPCAIGLSMPAVFSLAGYAGLKDGILFKNPDSFEQISKANHIVFDKTGTLTEGKMSLDLVKSLSSYSNEEILEIAAAIERYSEHPVAWAIVAGSNQKKLKTKKAIDFKAYPGQGVKAHLEGNEYFIGTFKFLKDNGNIGNKINETENNFGTKVFIGSENGLLGYFILSDQIKEKVTETLENLKKENIGITLLSGDKKNIVEKVARLLGINDVISEVLPEQKAEYISRLRKQGHRVIMAGDGINDAPAMTEADAGIAIGGKSNLTSINADIIILNNNFSTIWKTIKLGKKVEKIIKQNLLVSFTYNLLVIPFAVTGYITPLWAGVLMPCSSLIVLLNSLRVRK